MNINCNFFHFSIEKAVEGPTIQDDPRQEHEVHDVDILHLLFIKPQENEIKEKVVVLVKRSKALKVSYRIWN